MSRKSLYLVISMLMVASMVLAACQPAVAPTAEKVIETVVVEKPGESVVVTATPEPAKTVEFKSKDPSTIVVMSFGEPETIDPSFDYETAGSEIIQNTYDFLVFYNREKISELVPMLATELPTAANGGISADGMTYTFKIRTGVKFHNGDEMKPSDVAYTFQRGLLQGSTSSPQWLFFEPLMGSLGGANDITDLIDPSGALADDREGLQKADPAKLKEACTKVTDAIKADDAAGTVTFKLAQPWGPFLVTLAGSWGAIQDQKYVAANGGWDGSCDTWQKFYGVTSEELNKGKLGIGENGTGPYKLDHWTNKQEIVLTANEDYWAKEPIWKDGPSGAPKTKTIIIKSVDEFSTRYAAFQAGDADFIVAGSPENWPQLDNLVGEKCTLAGECTPAEKADNPARVFEKVPSISRTDAFFNFKLNAPDGKNDYFGSGKLDGNGITADFFSDVHIRKAFAYCFDWETYIKDVLQGEGTQAPTMMLPGEPGFDDKAPVYTYDPAKCEEEFKASALKGVDGKSLWDTGFRMTVAYNTGNTARQTVAQIFQQEISAVNPKFVIEVTGLPWPAYLQAYKAKQIPFFIVGWQEDIPDPHNWAFTYAGKGGAYSGKQEMPAEMLDTFAPFITDGVHETDTAKRSAIYAKLNQAFFDNVPTILLANGTGRHYEQRWVKGYYSNPIYGGFYYYALSKD